MGEVPLYGCVSSQRRGGARGCEVAVQGLGFGAWCLGFRVSGPGFRVSGSGLGV